MHVRQLTASHAAAFQALRLLGLKESASSFGSSFEEEQDRTVDVVRAHLSGSSEKAFFGCFQFASLVGIVGVGREPGLKERHVAFVRSLYVAPDARGRGIGKSLLEAALRHTTHWPGVEQVRLAVTAANAPAVCLYRGLGFIEVGRMPRALRLGSDYFDELHMVRFPEDKPPRGHERP
jgi:ribosomal protein S18 acetylase RimI-like enzyme